MLPFRESLRRVSGVHRARHRLFGSGARRPQFVDVGGGATGCRHFTAFDKELPILDLVAVRKQSARWGPGGMRTVGIVDPSVARAHEEVGLWEPANRTPEVRAIDGEDLETLSVQVSYPARNICCLAIPRVGDGIPIHSKPGLPCWKLFQPAHRKPVLIAWLSPASYWGNQVPQDRHGQNQSDEPVEE